MAIKSKSVPKNIFYIFILTTITVILWIVFDVHRALTKKVAPEVSEKELKTLDPQIDLEIVESLKKKGSPTEEDFEKIPLERKSKFTVEEEIASPAASPAE